MTEEITLSYRESSFLTDIIIHEKSQQDETNTFLSRTLMKGLSMIII